AQGLWHDPSAPGHVEPRYSETLELDLATVVPSIAGPKRPQDRIEVAQAKQAFRGALNVYVDNASEPVSGEYDEALEESFPASDAPAAHDDVHGRTAGRDYLSCAPGDGGRASNPARVRYADGTEFELDHGAVTIAAITSCTNTSNPSVMIGAALLAKKAVERGLQSKPWVKTTLAPGSKVVSDYYER